MRTLEVGTKIKAFHPRMVGVVKEGTVVTIGRKYVHVDFGELLGGTLKVPKRHVLDLP